MPTSTFMATTTAVLVTLTSTFNVQTIQQADVVLRSGEYQDKPGKRVIVPKDFNIDVPIRFDGSNYYVHEYDLNVKLTNAVYDKLKTKGISCAMINSDDKSQDLNGAGRMAKEFSPKIYMSIHHNSFKEDSSGYFLMTNGDSKSSNVAQSMSNSLKNDKVPQMKNRVNDGYIGELNEKPGVVNLLLEAGFFSNLEEVRNCASDELVNEYAENIANELIEALGAM